MVNRKQLSPEMKGAMDIASVIRYRLEELGVEQRDLALGAGVTESYISQLLAKKKTPPSPDRTKIYEKIAKILQLPSKELAQLAETQRREELKRRVLDPPRPLFPELRQVILKKCAAAKKSQISSLFEREPFGEMERFITERLLEAVKSVAREGLEHPEWVERMAEASGLSSAAVTRKSILEFLRTDVFHVSVENCVKLLEPLIQSWDIEMGSFRMQLELSRKLTRSAVKRFEFREVEPDLPAELDPALTEFLDDAKLSAGTTEEEIAFLKRLRPEGKRASVLYYYRALQNLRDPLNFLPAAAKKLAMKGAAKALSSRDGGLRSRTQGCSAE